jgi:hypothetical protein
MTAGKSAEWKEGLYNQAVALLLFLPFIME